MIPCGLETYHTQDGTDYDCSYPNATHACEDCIINGGSISPISGKAFRGNLKPYIKAAKERHKA